MMRLKKNTIEASYTLHTLAYFSCSFIVTPIFVLVSILAPNINFFKSAKFYFILQKQLSNKHKKFPSILQDPFFKVIKINYQVKS